MTMFRLNGVPANVRALPILQSASGSIATFNTDLTENLVEVKCQIVAQQASGTPSPSNPRPIGVYDSLTLYHNDVNMWDEQWELGGINGSTGEPFVQNTTIRCKNFIPVKPDTSYYYYCGVSGLQFRICYYDITKTFISSLSVTDVNSAYTTPSNCYYVKIAMRDTYGTTYGNDISINYPSTDTAYHAFNGAYIPFGQTVANGVINTTTGKLHITHYCYELSENWGWKASGTYSGSMWIRLADILPVPTNNVCIMSHFETVQTTAQYGAGKCLMDYNSLNCWLSVGATLSDWQNYIVTQRTNGTPIQLYAELATPYDIQLDSITLQALLNENNIWCDTGDTEVKYWMSINKYIGQ